MILLKSDFPSFKWLQPRKLSLREVQNSDTRGTTISNDLNMAKWGHPTVLEQNWATKKLFLSLEDEGFTVWLWRFSFFYRVCVMQCTTIQEESLMQKFAVKLFKDIKIKIRVFLVYFFYLCLQLHLKFLV